MSGTSIIAKFSMSLISRSLSYKTVNQPFLALSTEPVCRFSSNMQLIRCWEKNKELIYLGDLYLI